MTQDLRRSTRLTPLEGHDLAVVRIGRSEWMARVVNESAGGMEVDLDGFPEVGVGERVVVKIYSGWYDLSVVRVEITDDTTRMGLKRVSSLPELQTLAVDAGLSRPKYRFEPSSHLGTGSILALCVAFGMVLPQLIDGAFNPTLGGGLSQSRPVAMQGLAFGSANCNANPLIYSLSSLSSPRVVESLSLSLGQQTRLQQICDETSQTLTKLQKESTSMPSSIVQRESAKAVERAMLRVLHLLDDHQIKRWIDSLNEPRSTEYAS